MTRNVKNLKKGQKCQKTAKIRDVKILQDTLLHLEIIQQPIFKP